VTDHHCPWTNNCIGHFNYGHFIRFLFYVDITCSYHLAMVSYRVMAASGRRYYVSCFPIIDLIFIILNYVFAVPVILVVGAFRYCVLLDMQNYGFAHCDYIVFIISIVCWAIPQLSKAGKKIKLQCYDDMVKLKR
jgi:hypothetical protein